jgi:hypothetical protein
MTTASATVLAPVPYVPNPLRHRYNAEVLCDSLSPLGVRLTSLLITFPRFILAELNTHRMFSRSSASSRAVPIPNKIVDVLTYPFVPESFTKHKKGMQADEVVDDDAQSMARDSWFRLRDYAVTAAQELLNLGIHKQHANRTLELFSWHTVLVTSTEWSNFFALRDSLKAQPEFQIVAHMMKEALIASRPVQAQDMSYRHMPFTSIEEIGGLYRQGWDLDRIAKMSVGRCARLSTMTFDGVRDPNKDVALAEELLLNGHMAPYEHIARPATNVNFYGNFRGWIQTRKEIVGEHDFGLMQMLREGNNGLPSIAF